MKLLYGTVLQIRSIIYYAIKLELRYDNNIIISNDVVMICDFRTPLQL
jgi:hypothetical protein